MTDQRALLIRDRLFKDPAASDARLGGEPRTEATQVLAQSSTNWLRHRPGPGGLLQYALHDGANHGFQGKTLQAIKFIQQHQHLYKADSGNELFRELTTDKRGGKDQMRETKRNHFLKTRQNGRDKSAPREKAAYTRTESTTPRATGRKSNVRNPSRTKERIKDIVQNYQMQFTVSRPKGVS